jgi:sodium/proline symporter
MSNTVWILIAFVIYAGIMIGIGFAFFRKSNNLKNYFLGGRDLGAWVAAISAQASDMSGWLLMGLPGAVYAFGTGQLWIAVGLAIGTALNWIFVAKRLRRHTISANDSITLPEYFENRFRDDSKILRSASAVFIILFFSVYTASGFVAGGTLFSQVFGIDYQIALFISVLVILIYTFLGGFAAVCWTDLIQGLLMLIAILAVPILALAAIGGPGTVGATLSPEFLNIFEDGAGHTLSAVSIISQLAWGLGYFGMPHILVRFMAIKSDATVKRSATIAIVWVLLTLSFAVVVGTVGAAYEPGLDNPETVFIQMIHNTFMAADAIIPIPLIGAIFLCAILAAIMSTADSQLLVTASSITGDLYRNSINTKASEGNLMWVSRGSVIAVSIVAYFIARNPETSIMGLVSNAWAGFGAAFGALVLLSLYWRGVTRAGAAAGIVAGGLTVIVWDYIPLVGSGSAAAPALTLGAHTGLYSLAPGFALSFAAILLCSKFSKEPPASVLRAFDEANDTGH